MTGRQPTEPSDQQLFAALAGGDPTALRRLMDRYDRLVRYTIFRASRQRCQRDPLWLDAIAGEVWTDLCRTVAARGPDQIASVHSFLIQLARRRCIDGLRRVGLTALSDQPGVEEIDAAHQQAAADQAVFEQVAQLEQIEALGRCLERLDDPADRQLCAELADLTAGRWKQVAERLKLPESTLRSRWKRLLGRLRACLEKNRPTDRA